MFILNIVMLVSQKIQLKQMIVLVIKLMMAIAVLKSRKEEIIALDMVLRHAKL